MWADLIARKDEWIGGTLTDHGDSMDRALGLVSTPATTKITGMTLTDDWFEVQGEDFTCGGDRRHLGISAYTVPKGALPFQGYGGHRWFIQKKTEAAA